MQRLFVESILAPKLNTVMYHFIYYHGERSLVKCNQTLFFQRTPSAIFVRSTSNLKQSDYWEKKSYSSIALKAMHRASKAATEKAAEMDLKIPVWKNGKIIFVEAKEKLKKLSYT